jgi:O-antigen/teichoic acid export membrane protein
MWFACVTLCDAVIFSIGLIFIYQINNGGILRWEWNWQIAKELLKDSWPLILSTAATMVYMRIDQVMIKFMLNNKDVGYYAAAVKLSEASFFIPTIVTSSLFPAILNAKKHGEKSYHSRLQQLYDLMVWISVAIAIPTTLLSPWIIKTFYGANYLPAASILSISTWAGIFIYTGVASSKWFLAENNTLILLYRTLCGAITNVILNLILIPKAGIHGAAIATLISYCVYGYFSMAVIKKGRINFIMTSKSFVLLSSAKRLLATNK